MADREMVNGYKSDSGITGWEFWIDVGGTFTDVIATGPDGELSTCKVLSSGTTLGDIGKVITQNQFSDERRAGDPPLFWLGYRLQFLAADGREIFGSQVTEFDSLTGMLTVADALPTGTGPGTAYVLSSGEEAPVLAIRRLLRLPLSEPVPAVTVRLGTTRGTNALLTRRGAKTAFVTTRGFADVLLIANQDRPRLFDLAIRKPQPLFVETVEIDERLAADGHVLQAIDREAVRAVLEPLRQREIEAVAICLMHAFANPVHEQVVASVARELGFRAVSVSCELAPLIKIVSRGETTVVDAYLNPVLQGYVQQLRWSLPESELRLMTSSGGLVSPAQFGGKDSVLSGPAGGVIGCSQVALQAGFSRCIGFDMGGTSTDVCRFDGRPDLEFETVKAGVRIVAPMVAVETVAAGGGSLCSFDGVKLVVGPDSAGSVPGPACYRRGGPLTVTDVNLFLGRVPAERFPFPLDRDVVRQHLETLAETIHAATGNRMTPHALAAGFVRVANENMVRPIRKISVEKGFDPRDYVLVSFGGAGGQHACAIARELGIRQIISHPLAGLLSAFGIGRAREQRFAETAVLKPFNADSLHQLREIFASLTRQATDSLLASGVPIDGLEEPIRTVEMRYRGQESTLSIPCSLELDEVAATFSKIHLERFGYQHSSRPLEVVSARVELSAKGAVLQPSHVVEKTRTLVASQTISTWFADGELPTAVFTRSELQHGDEIAGPAIVCEPSATFVIDPGFIGCVLSGGELLVTDLRKTETTAAAASANSSEFNEPDVVLLEVFNNQFAGIAEQMGVTLRKTSCSTNVKERLDFSCALFSAEGELVVNAPHIPVHLGAMGETVKSLLKTYPRMQPGDVFVTNDPYRGGSHLPDVTVITPVHDATSGELQFLTASRAHHAEIGGILPGSMPPFSKTLAEEGVLIREFQLVRGGESREAELRNLLETAAYPSRSVNDNLADIAAQVAANQLGVVRLQDMIARYSWPVVSAYMRHIRDAAERQMRQALSAVPDGRYSFTDHLDDGTPICVMIDIQGSSAIIDFAGTGPVMAGNLNGNRAIVTAAVMYVFRCLIGGDIPLNAGVLKPLEIRIPENCLLNPPVHNDPQQCAAIVGGNVETSQRVTDCLLGALRLAAASQGTMNNFTFGNDRFGYYETICGGSGATAHSPGADAVHTHMTNTRLTDPEVIERRYPVRLRRFGIRRGSGGTGQHRGGDGVIREIEFLEPLRVSLLTERRGPFAPYGLNGGEPGSLGQNTLVPADGSEQRILPGKIQLNVSTGDLLRIETPGGGGCGKPAPG